ncbi:hypothetical protein OTU49_003825, partial [Cherax quadricarinatus]
ARLGDTVAPRLQQRSGPHLRRLSARPPPPLTLRSHPPSPLNSQKPPIVSQTFKGRLPPLRIKGGPPPPTQLKSATLQHTLKCLFVLVIQHTQIVYATQPVAK